MLFQPLGEYSLSVLPNDMELHTPCMFPILPELDFSGDESAKIRSEQIMIPGLQIFRRGEERPNQILEPGENIVILEKSYPGETDEAYRFLTNDEGNVLRFSDFQAAVRHLRTFTKTACGCGAPSDFIERPGERRPRRYKAAIEQRPVW